MAQVKMDLTEYEALKKVQAVLEKSNKDKDLLHKEIVELKAEKLKALEEAQNRIILEEVRTVRTYRHAFRSEREIEQAIKNFFNPQMHNSLAYLQGRDPATPKVQLLMDQVFDQEEVNSFPEDKTLRIIGNDEAKAIIRKELEFEYEQRFNSATQRADSAVRILKQYKETYKEGVTKVQEEADEEIKAVKLKYGKKLNVYKEEVEEAFKGMKVYRETLEEYAQLLKEFDVNLLNYKKFSTIAKSLATKIINGSN